MVMVLEMEQFIFIMVGKMGTLSKMGKMTINRFVYLYEIRYISHGCLKYA